jgi:hypothetical protein
LRSLVPTLLIAVSLAACGQGAPYRGLERSAVTGGAMAATSAATTTPVRATGTPAAPAIPLAKTEPMPAIAPASIPTPQRLVGMSPDDLIRVLGEPGFKRRDDPAEIWQYKGAGCFLDVFLYREPGGAKVRHVDVRGLSVVKVPGEECVLDVLKTKAKAEAPTG